MSYKTNYELYVSKPHGYFTLDNQSDLNFLVSRKHRQQTVTPTRGASLTVSNALPACRGPAATI